jgi:serine/threonine protein kinase/Tol biopolymer transport system component
MGLKSVSRAPSDRDDNPDGGDSVTDMGEPALVRATALEIARGAVLAGRYQVEAVIGRGGSGIVLRAFDRVTQVPVAIKILKPDLAADPHWIERFSRELRLARQIQHPNVCRVFDIGQADGHWFITMELATGGTLRDQLGEHAKSRPLEERLADVRAVVAGLAVIHDAGIVHRDVKPDNFLRMADGRLVLTDFGLATNPNDAPIVSIMVGTPYYMAPEIVVGEAASTRSDVWATGVVLHEIMTGTRPDRRAPQCEGSIAAAATPSEKAVLTVCASCLADEPDDRPESGRAIEPLLEAATTRRPRTRGGRKAQLLWGATALGVAGLGVVFGNHLWRPTLASTSAPADPLSRAISITGTPADWSIGAKRVAHFDERVHCFSVLPGGETAQVVWASPRRAENVNLSTGERTRSPLRPETFAVDCPQPSPTGDRLLFTQEAEGAVPRIVLAKGDGSEPKVLTSGTEPLWLPNGEEFLFDVDSSHAGVFSIPTMSYNLLSDDRGQGKRVIYRKAIDPRGEFVAVEYNSDTTNNRVLQIHTLPNLGAVATWGLPFSARDVRFGAPDLLISDETGVGTLDRLDWKTGEARRIGFLPGAVLRTVTTIPNGTRVLLSSTERSDVWIFDPGRPPRQLTTDGHNFGAAWSPKGEVLVGRALPDGRYVIVRYERDGSSHQVTQGPSDCVPSFAPDGMSWLYADYERKAIMRCEHDACRELVRDPQLPEWPVIAPDQKHIAYITVYGSPRLLMANADGNHRLDLGPTAVECPPVWTSATSLWAFSGGGDQREWAEIDVSRGSRTGRSKPARTFNPDKQTCGWEDELPSSPFYQRVRILPRETWNVAASATAPGLD